VIPVIYKSKSPVQRWKKFQAVLPTRQQLDRWFSRSSNYGVVAGWNGLTIIDFDDAAEYTRWRIWCANTGGIAQDIADRAWQVSTQRGVHVYIRLNHTERNRKLGKVDIKARNGYVLGAGSVHPSGAVYKPMRERIVLPLVEALSDVLPPALLSTDTEQTSVVLPQIPSVQPGLAPTPDPWAAVERAGVMLGVGAVEKIKQRYRIEDLFADKEKTGAHWYLARCPLHDDKSPSMWIDTAKQLCGCFAGCLDKPADVINLYARVRGLSNREAIHALAGVSIHASFPVSDTMKACKKIPI
jgi:hypothetical protein